MRDIAKDLLRLSDDLESTKWELDNLADEARQLAKEIGERKERPHVKCVADLIALKRMIERDPLSFVALEPYMY